MVFPYTLGRVGPPPSRTNAQSPSLPLLGGSQLPGQQPLLCLSTPALPTPRLSPRHKPTSIKARSSTAWRKRPLELYGRGALDAFVLFSVPLCFQNGRTSKNTRPRALSRPLLSALYSFLPHPHRIGSLFSTQEFFARHFMRGVLFSILEPSLPLLKGLCPVQEN